MKIGIIGAGYVGRSLAGACVKAGYETMISNSRGPHTLFSECALIGCKAGTIEQAAAFGDLVIVAITMKHYKAVPPEPLAGKIVVDANNYYPGRDECIPDLDNHEITSSELLAAHLPTSKVVKAFNAITSPDFDKDGLPPGTHDRRALPLSADDETAKKVVSDLCNQFGFDPVDVGPLSESWRFETNTPVYCTRFNKEWIQKALAAAVR